MSRAKPSLIGRAGLLATCVAAGAATGVAVEGWLHSPWGYLAIPGLIALVWLFIADPGACGCPPQPPADPAADPPANDQAPPR